MSGNNNEQPTTIDTNRNQNRIFGDCLIAENITTLISVITAGIGVAATTIKAIHVWVDERKSRKIKIKYKDVEMELSGSISEDEIYNKLQIFTQFRKKINKNEVEIILVGDNKPNKTNSTEV